MTKVAIEAYLGHVFRCKPLLSFSSGFLEKEKGVQWLKNCTDRTHACTIPTSSTQQDHRCPHLTTFSNPYLVKR